MTMTTDVPSPLSADERTLRQARAAFPSGVTIVTTTDARGERWGFTASSFCSVSIEPALVLVCLANTAASHQAFHDADSWAIHILHAGQSDLAMAFATSGADKFSHAGFVTSERGLPILPESSVTLQCVVHEKVAGGDHTILVGRVVDAAFGEAPPVVYHQRRFIDLADSPPATVRDEPAGTKHATSLRAVVESTGDNLADLGDESFWTFLQLIDPAATKVR
jgi:flavin reductase ActVB